MHRFFVSPERIRSSQVLFNEAHSRQMAKVLRLGPADVVTVLDDHGWSYEIELVTVKADQVTGKVRRKSPADGEPAVQLTVCQSVLKHNHFEWVLQKGTELGVAHFIPVITSRTIARDTEIKENKRRRWRRIITEAAEQCGRGRLPRLEEARTFDEALQLAQSADKVLMPKVSQDGGRMTIADSLRDLELRDVGNSKIVLLTGPEGGFTDQEAQGAMSAGVVLVTLGPRILRAETATIAAVTLIMQEMGQLV